MAADEGTQDTLRLQFKALQEMQHKRLQKQMEKQKEKELNLEIKVDDQKESFEISDGLSLLQAGEQNSKNSFEQRMLEDEVAHLREQLRETVDENGRLYKLLKERDFEIKHLKKKIEEDRFAFTGTAGVAGDAIATKIVELSKKNRVLTAESEGAKTRVKQLGNRVRELERELQAALTKLPATAATDAGTKASRAQMGDRALPETPEVKALQDRLAATNLKMSDLRNQIQSVKQELRMAQKVLISEVGEDVNVQQLLSSPGTWRGRAQQILVLQSKRLKAGALEPGCLDSNPSSRLSSCTTLGKFLHLSGPRFSSPYTMDNNRGSPTGLMGGLNESMRVKWPTRCLAWSEHCTKVECGYLLLSPSSQEVQE